MSDSWKLSSENARLRETVERLRKLLSGRVRFNEIRKLEERIEALVAALEKIESASFPSTMAVTAMEALEQFRKDIKGGEE